MVVEHGRRGPLRLKGGANPARVIVRTPEVEAVRIDGSGEVRLRDLRGARIDASIFGSGEVRADGAVERVRSRIDGSGSLRLAALRTEEAVVAISGSGAISYAGDPEVSEDVNGSGRVERR